MSGSVRSVLRYPGGKARIAPWIAGFLPPHRIYVEPFFGAGSVLFAKPAAAVEVVSDLDGSVVNLFCVLRDRPDDLARAVALTPYARAEYLASDDPTDDPVEAARRFLVRVWMAHGGKAGSRGGWRQGWAGGSGPQRGSSARVWQGVPDRIVAAAERLRGVVIDCRPALDVLADWAVDGAVVYADPPYPMAAGVGRDGAGVARGRYYRHEMTDGEHLALIDALDVHPGPVLLSGYRCPLYDDRLGGWVRVDRSVRAYRGAARVETLWLNRRAMERVDLFSAAGVEVAS